MHRSSVGRSPRLRQLAGRRLLRLLVPMIGCLAIAYVAVRVGGWVTPWAAQAAVPGMASVSGTVESTTPFTAAQVFLRNTDKHIVHMVFTSAGRFRAAPLFPGTYEINVTTKGLASEVQKLSVKAGDNPQIKLSLRAVGSPTAQDGSVASGDAEADTTLGRGIANNAAYNEVYPPGPGREVAERTCMICHGQDFLSRQPAGESIWNFRVDHMMGKTLFDRPAASYAEGLLSYRASALRFSREDRQALVAYLVKNFGPAAKPRRVRIEQEMPFEEANLGKAMFIEYLLPDDPQGEGVHAAEFNGLKAPFCCGRRVGQDVRLDNAGNVWLTERGYPHRLVKLDPRTGELKDYRLPNGAINGIHDVLIDRTGMVWLPEASGAGPSETKHLLGFNPTTEKWEESIPLDPDNVIRNPIKWTQSMTVDSKGNLYVGWIMGGALSKVDRATKKVSVFPLPTHNAIVYGVVADRNDNIFMALWDSGNIAKFDTHNNQWTTFTPPTYPGHSRRPNVDAQNNVWWGIWSAGPRPGKLAKLDQATGQITEYTIPRQDSQPYDVSPDAEGNIWAADGGGTHAALWKFVPRDQRFVLYPKPQAQADTPKIQVTKDGAIWYSPRGSRNAPAIGVLYPDMDKITTLGAFPSSGAPGFWFTSTTGN